MSALTDKEVDTLTSYADGEARVRMSKGVGSEELRQLGLDAGVEKCPSCGWWAECGEMLEPDSDEPDGHCCNCRVRKE